MPRPETLIPRWFTVATFSFLTILTLLFAVGGLIGDGPMAAASVSLSVATLGTLVGALATLTRSRDRRELTPGPDGTVVVDSPLLLTVGLLVAWPALLVACGLYGWVALTDFDAIEAPGATLVAVVGAVASIPDLVRLLTGRLHRWRITMTPDVLHYRGYRTSATLPWADVRRVEVQRRRPAGVRVCGTRAGDADVELVIPALAFTVPAEQLVDEFHQRA